jgi:hypothetical protein
MTLPQPSGTPSFEEFLDFLAFWLSTNEHTKETAWIIGDTGMGAPQQTPFGYIAPRNDSIPWMTADGSVGGMTGGPHGVDDHLLLVALTIAVQPHAYLQPVEAAPPESSPLSKHSLGSQPPYFEQPGYRAAMQLQDRLRRALRENITLGGEIATMRIIESAYVLQSIESDIYRALRITIQAQQRRRR